MDEFLEYLDENLIKYKQQKKNIFLINSETFQYVDPIWIKTDNRGIIKKTLTHFRHESFELIHSDCGYDNIVILFMGRYYFIRSTEMDNPILNELKWIGKASQEIETKSLLGVHGGFDLMRGSGSYSDYIKKAKFIGLDSLGLIEKNTLAGTLKFQIECLKNDIKPILGATFTIKREKIKYDVKFYVKNWQGWNNLLSIQYDCNVTNRGWVNESEMLQKLEGLFIILDPKSINFEDIFPIDIDNDIFYQLDTVEYDNNDKDIEYLENLKKFINSDYKPVSIRDAYYIDKKDFEVKEILSKMSNLYTWTSNNQYIKTNDEYFLELAELFKEEDERLFGVFEEAVKNEEMIADKCSFNIDTSSRHLPEYELTDEEKEKYGNKETMFWELIQEGLEKKYPDYGDVELERIEEEAETIELGGVVDYFLNTRAITSWADSQGILRTPGRGSAGGSLISNLLNITMIDPIEYGLLFSRFLNKGRVGTPIDCDIIKITTDEGIERTLYPDDEITIYNNGAPEIIKVKQLKEGDEIQ